MVVIFLPAAALDRERARARRLAVDVDGAGAALGDAAAILRAGQADSLANHPEQRRIRFDVNLMRFSIDAETDHAVSSLTGHWWAKTLRVRP